jgi:hypothetical protein
MSTLNEIRVDFEHQMNRSMSMPLAGMVVWLLVAIAGLFLPIYESTLVMLLATGAIFPLALLFAKFRNERLVSSSNPLAKLMGLCVLMVNLLWAVHVPLLLNAPQFVPLSLGIGLGLHWIVYSWIIQHPLGTIHAVMRTLLIIGVWLAFPTRQVAAVGFVIVLVYGISLLQMSKRKLFIAADPAT